MNYIPDDFNEISVCCLQCENVVWLCGRMPLTKKTPVYAEVIGAEGSEYLHVLFKWPERDHVCAFMHACAFMHMCAQS